MISSTIKINQAIADSYPWRKAVSWTKRTRTIAELIPGGHSVLDIGGGMGNLAKVLSGATHYLSIDNKPWTSHTIVADLNFSFPDVVLPGPVCIVAQGIIEYIRNPIVFLENLQKYGDTLILSYRRPADAPMTRHCNVSFAMMHDFIKASGWKIEEINHTAFHHKQIIEKVWRLYR